jgi:hypothetical protein
MFCRHTRLGKAQGIAELVEVDLPASWNDDHVVRSITEDDNRLGNFPRWQVFGSSNLARCERFGMSGDGEVRAVGGEEITQSI